MMNRRPAVHRPVTSLLAASLVAAGFATSTVLAMPSQVTLTVSVTDRQGQPISGLTDQDFSVTEDGEPRKLVSSSRAGGPHHWMLIEDAAWSSPGHRYRALPPLRDFLLERLAAGDRVSVALLEDSARQPAAQWLCLWSTEAELVRRAFETLSHRRSAAFRAREQRGETFAGDLEKAYEALAATLAMGSGDQRGTSLLYLGQTLTETVREVLGTSDSPVLTPSPGGDADVTDAIGTVQYLVSLPRSGAGPLEDPGRSAGDRLLSAALTADVAVYPLVAERSDLGADFWLASETGGASLSIRQLRSDLERLGRQVDDAYELVFERAGLPDQRFHRVEVETPKAGQVRHSRGLRAGTDDEALAARARAALRLGAESNPLQLAATLAASTQKSGGASLDLSLPDPSPEGSPTSQQGRLRLYLALKADGQIFSSRQVLTFTSRPGKPRLLLRIPLRLPEDTQELGLALQDMANGRVSALKILVREDL